VEGGVGGQGWKATDKRVSEQETEEIVIDWGIAECTINNGFIRKRKVLEGHNNAMSRTS
jgi:hypothetical protein